MNHCKECGNKTVRKLLLTSYYEHCDYCENRVAKKSKLVQELKDAGIKVREPSTSPALTAPYGNAPTRYQAPMGQSSGGDPYTYVGRAGGSGRSTQNNPALTAPYGQTPNHAFFYPKDDPKDCLFCVHKLACGCISFILNGNSSFSAHGVAQILRLERGDLLEFKDSHFNYVVPVGGTYRIDNKVGVPNIRLIP